MDHYLDLRLRTDPEIPAFDLMSALFGKLHRALARMNNAPIGVSFPDHNAKAPHLGLCLRLHGTSVALSALLATDWLQGVRDHVHAADIQTVPANALHRRVYRVQAKSSPERLRRRAMRRHGIDADAARQRIPDSAAEALRLPFVTLGSRSTGQPSFNLYIQHGPTQPTPLAGELNAYGLSKTATVPWF